MDELIAAIQREEQAALLRAQGRIESRKRFKYKGGQPLHAGRKANLLFIDESGRSYQEAHLGEASFFALGAVSMTEESAHKYIEAADELKRRFFGTTEITFHEPAMRTNDGPYYFAGDSDTQEKFDARLNELIDATEFVAFGAGIRKHAFQAEFIDTGIDPYLPTDVYAVAIQMLLERYVDYLATSPDDMTGRVTFESLYRSWFLGHFASGNHAAAPVLGKSAWRTAAGVRWPWRSTSQAWL